MLWWGHGPSLLDRGSTSTSFKPYLMDDFSCSDAGLILDRLREFYNLNDLSEVVNISF